MFLWFCLSPLIIMRLVAQNRPFVLCEGITPVECILLAPDIALANFEVKTLHFLIKVNDRKVIRFLTILKGLQSGNLRNN